MKIIVADEIKYAIKDENNYDIYWITSNDNVFNWAILLLFGGIFSVLFGLLSFGTGSLFVMSVIASNLISFIEVVKQFYKADQQSKLNANIFSESLINAINKFNQLLNQDKKIKILFKHKQDLKLNLYTQGGSGLQGIRYKTWIKFGDGQRESFVNFNPFRMIALLQLVKDNNNKDTIDAITPVLALYDTSIKRYGYYRINNTWYDFGNNAPTITFEIDIDNFIYLNSKIITNYGTSIYEDIFFLTIQEFSLTDRMIHNKYENWVNKLRETIGFLRGTIKSTQKTYFETNDFNQSQELYAIKNLVNDKKFRFHFLGFNDSSELQMISANLEKINPNAPIKVHKFTMHTTFTIGYYYIENAFFTAYSFENVKLRIVFKSKVPAMNIFDLLIIINNYKQLLFRQQFFYRNTDGNIYLYTAQNFHNQSFNPDEYIKILNYEIPYQVFTPDEIPELDLDYEIIKNENNYTFKIDKITILPIRVDIYDTNNHKIHTQVLKEDLIINLNYNENYKIQYYLVKDFDTDLSFVRIGNLYEKIINIPKQNKQENNIPIIIKPIEKPKNENNYKPSNLTLDSKIVILLALLLTLYFVFKNQNEN